MTHLHWLHSYGQKALVGVQRAASLCGKMDLPREHVTSFRDDCTCQRCLELSAWATPLPGATKKENKGLP